MTMPTHTIANIISDLTGEPEQLRGAPVIILGAGGYVGDTTVLITESLEDVKARAVRNNPIVANYIAELYDDFTADEYHFTDEQRVVLAAHGIATDARLVVVEVMRDNLEPYIAANRKG